MLLRLSNITVQNFLLLILGEVKYKLATPGCILLMLGNSVFLLRSVCRKHVYEGN